MSTITPVNNTVNDIIFTPDPNAAGAHIYDIADTITGKVVGTLEINTMFVGLYRSLKQPYRIWSQCLR